MAKSSTVEQLRTLNELLCQTGVSSPECAENARRALDFYRQESPTHQAEISLQAAASQLVRLHFGDSDGAVAFAHWHVPAHGEFDPLWVREALIAEMKTLAGRQQALFLVTGLRESVCPPGKYWTASCQQTYTETLDWMQTLLCAWVSRCTQLQLVII